MAPKHASTPSASDRASASSRAGLIFSVARSKTRVRAHPSMSILRGGVKRIRTKGVLWLTAATQFVVAEHAVRAAKDVKDHDTRHKDSKVYVMTKANVLRARDYTARVLTREDAMPMPLTGKVLTSSKPSKASAAADA